MTFRVQIFPVLSRFKEFSYLSVKEYAMAEKDTPTRSRSDLLWRITRVVPKRVYNALKARAAANEKEADRFAVLAYYREMADWDSKQEATKQKSDPNFARNKFRAYHYLIEALAEYGCYPYEHVHKAIEKIRVEMAFACYPEAINAIQKVKAACIQDELFREHHEILRMEMVAVTKVYTMQEALDRIEGIKAEIAEVEEKINEMVRWEQVASDHRYPSIAMVQRDGHYDEAILANFESHISKPEMMVSVSVRAREMLYLNRLYVSLARKENALVVTNWTELSSLQLVGWLAKDDPTEYAGNMAKVVSNVSTNKDIGMSMKLIQELEQFESKDELTNALVADRVILGYFFLYWNMGDIKAGTKGCHLFDLHRCALKNAARPIIFFWLRYYYAIHKFSIQRF